MKHIEIYTGRQYPTPEGYMEILGRHFDGAAHVASYLVLEDGTVEMDYDPILTYGEIANRIADATGERVEVSWDYAAEEDANA